MATQGRDITKVIDAILLHIPKEMIVLRARLERIKYDAGFIAPEVMRQSWFQLMKALQISCNNPPKLDWELRVSAIIEDREPVD